MGKRRILIKLVWLCLQNVSLCYNFAAYSYFLFSECIIHYSSMVCCRELSLVIFALATTGSD